MPNRLIREQSPYLLQHAHNPVDWYAWSDEPFERAKLENKPVLISIGYSACHWCHVMEHESFENEEVALFMNSHFINIKVDREERPDVDHIYMDAIQAISGSGGWPLNVFVTPDKLPFFGGTYFPPKPAYGRQSWMQVLSRIHDIWQNQAEEVAMQSNQMLAYLQNVSKSILLSKATPWDDSIATKMARGLLKYADKESGGFGRAPKFPSTMAISYLLEYYHYTKDTDALQHALLSLDAMIQGGIYDQLGGGFARYSTDDKWLAPHFEKMLYDNALIIIALCDAYSITKNEHYEMIIRDTISFVDREMKSIDGGYFSALDADTEGVEGKYYTWTWEEWQKIADNDSILTSYFGVKPNGNWEQTNILHVAKTISDIANEQQITRDEVTTHITEAKRRLFEAREARIKPGVDDKCLLSWNALMNIALSKAAAVLGDTKYEAAAASHMDWMQAHFMSNGALKHSWKEGVARIEANLEDFAFLIQAMLQFASVSGNEGYIIQANELMTSSISLFSAEDNSFFYFSSSLKSDIPLRKIDTYDGATPSANAVMAHNLIILGLCMENNDYSERAYAMFNKVSGIAEQHIYSFSYWGKLIQRYSKDVKTVVCSHDDGAVLRQFCLPEAYIVTSKKEISEIPMLKHKISEPKTGFLICTKDTCMPVKPLLDDVLAVFGV